MSMHARTNVARVIAIAGDLGRSIAPAAHTASTRGVDVQRKYKTILPVANGHIVWCGGSIERGEINHLSNAVGAHGEVIVFDAVSPGEASLESGRSNYRNVSVVSRTLSSEGEVAAADDIMGRANGGVRADSLVENGLPVPHALLMGPGVAVLPALDGFGDLLRPETIPHVLIRGVGDGVAADDQSAVSARLTARGYRARRVGHDVVAD